MMKFLIQRGANVTISDGFSRAPLFWIAGSQRTDIAMMLLEKGADMHAKTRCGDTPFTFSEHAMRRFFEAYERARSFWLKQGCDRKQTKLLSDCFDHIQSFDEGAAQLR